jgi:hypothetical protein
MFLHSLVLSSSTNIWEKSTATVFREDGNIMLVYSQKTADAATHSIGSLDLQIILLLQDMLIIGCSTAQPYKQ